MQDLNAMHLRFAHFGYQTLVPQHSGLAEPALVGRWTTSSRCAPAAPTAQTTCSGSASKITASRPSWTCASAASCGALRTLNPIIKGEVAPGVPDRELHALTAWKAVWPTTQAGGCNPPLSKSSRRGAPRRMVAPPGRGTAAQRKGHLTR